MAKYLVTYLDWRHEFLVGVELRVRGRSRHPGPRDDEGGGRGMPQPRAAPVAGRAGQVRLPAAPAVAGTAARSPVDQGARRRHRRLLRLKKGKKCFILFFPEVLALKHESRILGHSSNPVCGFSMIEVEKVRLYAVSPMENWLGSSLNQIQGWTTVRQSYSRALEQRPLFLSRKGRS